jgi:hypothetical protein
MWFCYLIAVDHNRLVDKPFVLGAPLEAPLLLLGDFDRAWFRGFGMETDDSEDTPSTCRSQRSDGQFLSLGTLGWVK